MKTDLKQSEIEEIGKCLEDRYWRLNNLYWIMDEQGNKVQFKVNRVQYWLYTSMWYLNIILKSRQHGITTFICILFLDACLFNNDVRAGIIAHRLDDAKRIFRDKIIFAYEQFKKEWPELAVACKPTKEDSMEILFENNSGISVGTSMRSGTLQYLHISEYGWTCRYYPQKAREIKSGALETIHDGGIVFIEATAEGSGTDFENICKDAESIQHEGREPSKMEFKFFFFAWFEKPENVTDPDPSLHEHLNEYFDGIESACGVKLSSGQRTWYAGKKKILGTDIYKEHPSIPSEAFYASIEGAYYGTEMVLLNEAGNIGYYPHQSGVMVHTWWDLGTTYTSIGFYQFRGENIYCIDHYMDDLGQGLAHYASVFQEKQKLYGYVYGDHWLGPDNDPVSGSNKKNGFTGITVVEEGKRLGLNFKIVQPHAFNDRIRTTKENLKDKRVFFNKETTEDIVSGLKNYRRRKNHQLSTEERPVYFDEPVKDGLEPHMADQFGHMNVTYFTQKIQGIRIGQVKQTIKPRNQKSSPYKKRIITRHLRSAS